MGQSKNALLQIAQQYPSRAVQRNRFLNNSANPCLSLRCIYLVERFCPVSWFKESQYHWLLLVFSRGCRFWAKMHIQKCTFLLFCRWSNVSNFICSIFLNLSWFDKVPLPKQLKVLQTHFGQHHYIVIAIIQTSIISSYRNLIILSKR